MEIFQSWLDTVLIFALLISNILCYIIQKREISSLKSANEELNKINKAHVDLAENNAKNLSLFKDAVDIEGLYSHFDWKVESVALERVEKIADSVRRSTIEQVLSDNEDIIKQAIKIVIDDFKERNEAILQGHYTFLLFVISKNNYDENKIKALVDAFYREDAPFVLSQIERDLPTFIDTQTNS